MIPQQSSNFAAPPPSSGSLALSAHDVERLLTEETPEVRIDVLRKVAEIHAHHGTYSLKELTIAEQIFRVLLKDTEISVRESLAQALRENPKVPRDIVLALARDADTVAQPILESSEVLTESDLIALIQSAKMTSKPVAIARRKKVSETLSSALVETHNPGTVSQLMKNRDAAIPEEIYQEVLREHGTNEEVMSAVAARPNLPITIVEKVIILVSDTIAESLRIQYSISAATIAQETERTREVATLKLVDGQISARDVEKLVDQLQVFGRLSPSMILTALCRGNLYFFETSLARLSNIPTRNAQLLIHDKGGLGFKALYGKAGLPDKFFAACKLLLEVLADMQKAGAKGSGRALADAIVQRLLAKAAGQNVDNLSYIIALIRQNA